MSKFKVKLKLTGFELEIEGTREDIPLIAQSVGQQITGMLIPASDIVAGERSSHHGLANASSSNIIDAAPIKRRKKRAAGSALKADSSTKTQPPPISWKHDSKKWSSPNQTWTTLEKSLWLIYVVEQETRTSELSARQIAETFNLQFRQAGLIRATNVSRDLGNKKAGKEALVGENTTVTPATWFLTEMGTTVVTTLIQAGKS